MFWIAFLGLSLSWMLVRLGVMSTTVNFLMMGLKLMLVLMVIGGVIGAWAWFRRRFSNDRNKNAPALK